MDLFGFERGSAKFSPCGLFRYELTRKFGDGGRLVFVMLNPSSADADRNDPTVAKCVKFAKAWTHDLPVGIMAMGTGAKPTSAKYGELVVVNIFAYRSTNPNVLKTLDDPIGPNNDAAIVNACLSAATVVCAWGRHGELRGRGRDVVGFLSAARVRLQCFAQNADGSPIHPLYQPSDAKLVEFKGY